MNNKLEARYHEIEAELQTLREITPAQADAQVIQEKIARLEIKQNDLKQTLLHLIALSKIREEAFRALAY